MSRCLSELPFEILSSIVAHVDVVRTLLHLSLTCSRLHDYIEKEGFRVFVQNRFPLAKPPPYWRDAAHALTSVSRAWDEKSLLAESIKPLHHVVRLPRGRESSSLRRGSRQQTMGYQPVIDSYDEQTGKDWTSRREVLAWGAGAELIVRLTDMGEEIEKGWQYAFSSHRDEPRHEQPILPYDRNHHRIMWMTYKENWESDGRGDITSVNLFRPSQINLDGEEHIITGRANGSLDHVALSANRATSKIVTRYITNDRPVQSASLSTASKPLLAACLSGGTIAIYTVQSSALRADPSQEISLISDGNPCKIWSTRFLTPERLAVGLGRSREPIHIYEISPHGISETPLRKFGLARTDTESSYKMRMRQVDRSITGASVYPLAPIGPFSKAGGGAGVTFLSGWYDGSARYTHHRSPNKPLLTHRTDFMTSALQLHTPRFSKIRWTVPQSTQYSPSPVSVSSPAAPVSPSSKVSISACPAENIISPPTSIHTILKLLKPRKL